MNKQLSPRIISPQQLERIAAKLTLSSRALQVQILTLHRELAVTKRELVLSHQDLRDGLVRLHEIDEYVQEVQVELATQSGDGYSFTEEEVRSREEQLEELQEERQEELTLLEHVRAIIGLHESSQSKLRVVITALVRELCIVKRKEQLLVMLALRSRMVKLVPQKL
ncbi:hypothetical protein Gpo141_00011405 [Globisporangium polare]